MDHINPGKSFLSLRFAYADRETRFTVEGPVHFGPFDDDVTAKSTLLHIFEAARRLPTIEVVGIPRFTRGRYELATEKKVESLRVVDRRLGIAHLTAYEAADLRKRMRVIIPAADNEWREHLLHIPRYLMERVVRRHLKLFGSIPTDI